jgi:hypothetical protein
MMSQDGGGDYTERLLSGRDVPPPTPVRLKAGELELLFVDGDVRYLAVSGTELVRRVYVAVRDLDWNTLPGKIESLDIRDKGDSFEVRFTRRHTLGATDYRWSATISGDANGCIRYEMDGVALAEFPYAKIGICMHHPVGGFAGQPYVGLSPSGPVAGTLPYTIGPQVHLDDGTDLPLFEPVSQLGLTHSSAGVVSFDFVGDLFEMEDQRNWADASFKTSSTPAYLGYRHEATKGQRFVQSVTIRASDFAPRKAVTADQVQLGAAGPTEVPPIGISCALPPRPLSATARDVLQLVGPAHLRVDLDLATPIADTLTAAAQRAHDLGARLEPAVFVPTGQTNRDAALIRLAELLSELSPPPARILVYSSGEESTLAGDLALAVRHLGSLEQVPLVIGTNANFNELNRNRPAGGPESGLVWPINPQVHAFDELSLVENLQAQPETVTTARSFSHDRTFHVSPVTLRPRFNAVATTDSGFAVDGLPWNTDPRQPSLFAAAWTLGSIAALSSAGVASLTYYEDVGPRGLIESVEGSLSPDEFYSQADTAFALAVVLADACSLSGASLVEAGGFDPLRIGVLATDTPAGRSVLLANLTREEMTLSLLGVGASGTLRVLDLTTVGRAAAMPGEFLNSKQPWVSNDGALEIRLGPYGSARVDAVF